MYGYGPPKNRYPVATRVREFTKSFQKVAVVSRFHPSVLVTDNERDFQRIRRFLQFEFTSLGPVARLDAASIV